MLKIRYWVGAFLTKRPDASKAFDLAFADVLTAFEYFLREAPSDRPIILGSHSQGSLHLSRLLRERIAGTPLAKRIVAAYAVGWALSPEADIPHMGLSACKKAVDTGCILAWQTFGEPADPQQQLTIYDGFPGANGKSRVGKPMLCVNPLTGNAGDAAPASANLGSVVPGATPEQTRLVPGFVPARCDKQGLLLIGENSPSMPRTMAGNNYHSYDYPLFWANVRSDAERRVNASLSRMPSP